jgi:hypothetical protein
VREKAMLLFINTKNTTYFKRRAKAYTINALEIIQKYHKGETRKGHT